MRGAKAVILTHDPDAPFVETSLWIRDLKDGLHHSDGPPQVK